MSLHRIAFLAVIVVITGYIGLHLRGLLAPPPLEILFPPQGFTTSNDTIEIAGKTSPGAFVEVNGRPLPSPDSGQFSHLLVLDRGITTVTISARKRYSKSAVMQRQIFVIGGGEKISKGEQGGI